MFPVLDQDGWIQGPMEEALLLSDRLAAASVYGDGSRLSPGSTGLTLIQEESILRATSTTRSKPSSQATLRASVSSIQSAREPLIKHSLNAPHFHHIPPYTSPPTLTVPSVVRSRALIDNVEDFPPLLTVPTRSRSEKANSRKEFRPRSQTGDKTTLPAPPPVSVIKADSVPVNINSLKLVIDDVRDVDQSGVIDRRASRDSIQLIASPVVKFRTSSDEDSAIMSDNCDLLASDKTNSAADTTLVEPVNTTNFELTKVDVAHSQENNSSTSGGDNSSQHYFSGQEELPKDKSGNGEVVSFKIGGDGGSYTLSNNQSSSSDSSNRSKSRGSSFYNTDSSGVGSCDSNAMMTLTTTLSAAANALSPIPSSTSLTTLTTVSSSSNLLTGAEQTKEPVHHSALQRSFFKLTRIPSAKRRSASPALGITANGGQTFTSQRDAMGYAALRNIKRQRTYSSETDGDSLTHLETPMLHRTISQDSELSVDSNMWLR